MATATQEQSALDAQPRTPGTKNDARRVRREGKVPAVVYGAGKQSVSVSVDPRQVSRILNSRTGHNTVFDLALEGEGERTKVMIVDWQYEPIKGSLLHIDLKRIAMDQKLKVNVPIALVGEPEGVKTQGGILEQIFREVEVECLPGDIPNSVELNVSALGFRHGAPCFRLAGESEGQVHQRSEPAGRPRHHREGRRSSHGGCGGRRSGSSSGRTRSHQEGQAGDGRGRCRSCTRQGREVREEGKEIRTSSVVGSRSSARTGGLADD